MNENPRVKSTFPATNQQEAEDSNALPKFTWQEKTSSTAPTQQGISFFKKITTAPVLLPLRGIVSLSQSARENPELNLLVKGVTSQKLRETIEHHRQQPEISPQLPQTQTLEERLVVYEERHPTIKALSDNYYQTEHLSKIAVFQPISNLASTYGQKAANKFFSFLGKTAVGKAAKSGAKKAATWAIGKLGLAAIPEPTVSKALLILSTAKSILKKVGGFFHGALIKLRDKPEILVAAGLTLIALPILLSIIPIISMIMTAIGAVTTAAGLIGSAGKWLGGAMGKAGGFLGSAANYTSGLFSTITHVSISPTLLLIVAPGAVIGAGIGAFFVNHVASSAFVVPPEVATTMVSQDIKVTKTAAFSGVVGTPIEYKIQISATGKDLTGVTIVDQASATCTGTPPSLSDHSWNIAAISNGQIIEETYSLPTNDQFNNCLISNTAKVMATVDGHADEAVAVYSVAIGTPPVCNPMGLPVHDNPHRCGGYTYGEATGSGPHNGIDVRGAFSTNPCLLANGDPQLSVPVYSTYPCESTVVNAGSYTAGGNFVNLAVGEYSIHLCHLKEIPSVVAGQKIPANGQVGIQGNTGTKTTGEHVHYMIYKNGVVVDPRPYGITSISSEWND